MTDAGRHNEIAANLAAVRQRIARACAEAGRAPGEVTLTVVTKFFPASDLRILADLGVRHVGENRHQEARAKAAQTGDLPLRWHFIGTLQTNKAAAVAGYADVVESVDRVRLLPLLAKGAAARSADLDCLVQVDLDPRGAGPHEPRGGAVPQDVPGLADRIRATTGLRLRGVMAVAPLGVDPASAFDRLAGLADLVRSIDPAATWLSAGMSGDLEAAIAAGATHLRIGSAVLGKRPSV